MLAQEVDFLLQRVIELVLQCLREMVVLRMLPHTKEERGMDAHLRPQATQYLHLQIEIQNGYFGISYPLIDQRGLVHSSQYEGYLLPYSHSLLSQKFTIENDHFQYKVLPLATAKGIDQSFISSGSSFLTPRVISFPPARPLTTDGRILPRNISHHRLDQPPAVTRINTKSTLMPTLPVAGIESMVIPKVYLPQDRL